MIECVLFDFFGTLVDYTHGRTDQDFSSSHALLQSHGVSLERASMVASFDTIFGELEQNARETEREFSMQEVVTRVLAHHGCAVTDDVVEAMAAAYVTDWQQHVSRLPGIEGYLQGLSRRYRLGIITNTHYAPMISGLLQQMGAEKLFDPVITSVEHGRPKPHPAIFEHTLAVLDLAPTQAVYVGDSFDADYRGATGVGMGCYLVGRHARVPVHRQIASVFDLPARLD